MTQPNPDSPRENYTWRNTNIAKEIHGVRTAANVGGFFTPHLRSGMHLLDCGCGLGSVTVGLAEIVAPGPVIGIDANADLIAAAQAAAAEQDITNATFQTGDVYSLPFDDGTFDAVWVHALLEHLADPAAALREMQRVLKPGGVIGVRELDLDSLIFAPESPALARFFELWSRLTRDNSGDVEIGKKLGALLMEAGFQDVGMSATVEHYGASVRAPFVPPPVTASNLTALLGPCEERGYAPAAEIAQMRQALADWAAHPQGLLLFMRCEAIGYK